MDKSRAQLLIFGSAAIGGLGNFANHAILPALAAIRAELGGSIASTQLLISLALFALAIGNLVVAPLSDRYGRRPVILYGLAIYTLCATAAVFVGNIALLVAARIGMAFGSGGAQSVSRAALIDFFGPERAASGLAYTATASLLVPMLAPTIGGYTVEYYSWRWIFILCAAAGVLVTLFSWLRLAETHAEARDRGADQRSFASYKILLASPRFMTQVFFGSCLLSLPFTVISGAPYVGIEIMGLSPSAYGKLFALPAAASFVGFLSAARLTRRWGARRMMRIGLTTATIGASSMLLLFALHVWHPMALFIPAMLVCFSNALAMPASMTAAIAVHPEVAGAASGLLGFVQLAIAALCSELVALFANHTPFPLAGIEFGLVCGALLLWGMIGRQPR